MAMTLHTPNGSIRIAALDARHANACLAIGRALPAWFGIEEGLADLRTCAERGPGFVALDDEGGVVGFVTVTHHFAESREISWMAVAPDRHRQGIGRALIAAVMDAVQIVGVTVVQVKTLAATHPSPEYATTRAFYAAQGFVPVEVFPDLWGAANPALQLVRVVRP